MGITWVYCYAEVWFVWWLSPCWICFFKNFTTSLTNHGSWIRGNPQDSHKFNRLVRLVNYDNLPRYLPRYFQICLECHHPNWRSPSFSIPTDSPSLPSLQRPNPVLPQTIWWPRRHAFWAVAATNWGYLEPWKTRTKAAFGLKWGSQMMESHGFAGSGVHSLALVSRQWGWHLPDKCIFRNTLGLTGRSAWVREKHWPNIKNVRLISLMTKGEPSLDNFGILKKVCIYNIPSGYLTKPWKMVYL